METENKNETNARRGEGSDSSAFVIPFSGVLKMEDKQSLMKGKMLKDSEIAEIKELIANEISATDRGYAIRLDIMLLRNAVFTIEAMKKSNNDVPWIDEWAALDVDHKNFILRVRDGNGEKYSAEPHGVEMPTKDEQGHTYIKALWTMAEKSGFVECIGSFKWVVTKKFRELEKGLFQV